MSIPSVDDVPEVDTPAPPDNSEEVRQVRGDTVGEKAGLGGEVEGTMHGNSDARGENLNVGVGFNLVVDRQNPCGKKSKKKPFNILTGRHLKKASIVSPMADNRPRKRSRLETVDSFIFLIGEKAQVNINLNEDNPGRSSEVC
ncbi:hypothetical protein Hanom_Chr08g00735451 [Helianthus anomalus]